MFPCCYLPIDPEALAFLGLAFLGIVPVGEIACHVVVDTDLLQKLLQINCPVVLQVAIEGYRRRRHPAKI